jgi:hypothetical protein
MAGLVTGVGCKPDNPLEGVLGQLVKAAKAGDQKAFDELIDAETSHKLLTARLVLLLPKEKQNEAFEKAEAEMKKGPEAINQTRSTISGNLAKKKELLSSGACKLTNPKPEDQQAVMFPTLPSDAQEYMSKELGGFVFNLKASAANSVAVRVACGENKEFVFYAYQGRKQGNETPPWKILGVTE